MHGDGTEDIIIIYTKVCINKVKTLKIYTVKKLQLIYCHFSYRLPKSSFSACSLIRKFRNQSALTQWYGSCGAAVVDRPHKLHFYAKTM